VTGSPKLAALALHEVAKLLEKLTEEQLMDLVDGRAVVEFRTPEVTVQSRTPKRRPAPRAAKRDVDLDDVMREIQAMTEEDAVEEYLRRRDKDLTADSLRALAERIGPHISTKGTKATLRKNIAAGTAGLLNRPASVFSGGWER
jgi:chromatin segregation and condensation protein Rec8/ScpA/Scc1 (kleisin family)